MLVEQKKGLVTKAVTSAVVLTSIINPLCAQASENPNQKLLDDNLTDDDFDNEVQEKSVEEIMADAISPDVNNVNNSENTSEEENTQNNESERVEKTRNNEEKIEKNENEQDGKDLNTNNNCSDDERQELFLEVEKIIHNSNGKITSEEITQISKLVSQSNLSETEKEELRNQLNDYQTKQNSWKEDSEIIKEAGEKAEKRDTSQLNNDFSICENILREIVSEDGKESDVLENSCEIKRIINGYKEEELNEDEKSIYSKIKIIDYWVTQLRRQNFAEAFIQYWNGKDLADKNYMHYDEDDKNVYRQPVSDFTPNIIGTSCRVPYKLLKRYVQAEYFVHHESEKNTNGTGAAIAKEDVYFLLNDDNKTSNNIPLTRAELKKGNLYFHPYVIKWHKSYDTEEISKGFHLDGYVVKITKEEEIEKVPVIEDKTNPGRFVVVDDEPKDPDPDPEPRPEPKPNSEPEPEPEPDKPTEPEKPKEPEPVKPKEPDKPDDNIKPSPGVIPIPVPIYIDPTPKPIPPTPAPTPVDPNINKDKEDGSAEKDKEKQNEEKVENSNKDNREENRDKKRDVVKKHHHRKTSDYRNYRSRNSNTFVNPRTGDEIPLISIGGVVIGFLGASSTVKKMKFDVKRGKQNVKRRKR